MAEQEPAESELREAAWVRWRADVARRGGFRGLLHFDPSRDGGLDLTNSHPGGFAQLLSGRVTKLSNLIREPTAFAKALAATRLIEFRASELAEDRGIDAVTVVTGIVSWKLADERYSAPILLQPARINGTGADFEVKLDGAPRVNPALLEALRTTFHSSLDAEALVAAAYNPNAYHPETVIEGLAREFSLMPALHFDQRLVLTTCSDFAERTAERVVPRAHPVLDAIAGIAGAQERVDRLARQVEVVSSDQRSPESDTLVLDAGAEQERLVAQAMTGSSFAVRTVPGAGVTQTTANIAAELVRDGRRVAVVAASRASLRRVERKLAEASLPALCVRPEHLRADVIAAISRNERTLHEPPRRSDPVTFTRLRKALLRYRRSLLDTNARFGVSVEQALNELARLAALPDPPQTTVRLDTDAIYALAGDRTQVARELERAAELGEFTYGPADSAWYGARFDDPDRARDVWAVAKRLSETDLPTVRRLAVSVSADAGLREPRTTRELGQVVELLMGVRDTLDRFTSEVFERSLTEVIAATAPDEADGLTRRERRQLRQLAHEYVRPGAHVGDLHAEMVRIQEQRVTWNRTVRQHRSPRVPADLRDLEQAFGSFRPDLVSVGAPLPLDADILDLGFDDLERLLGSLARDVGALSNLRERVAVLAGLRARGLDGLLTDFAARHVESVRVRDELEQAWWQSVLGHMLELDGSLLNANTDVLSHLERDFMRADQLHVQSNAGALRQELARRWSSGLHEYADQAQGLRQALLDQRRALTVGRLLDAAPALSRVVAPVWLLSPYAFAQEVPARMHFDTVIVLDAAQIAFPELVVPIAQGDQVIAFGDPSLLGPQEFAVAPAADAPDVDAPAEPAESAFAVISAAVPHREMTQSYRAGGRELAAIVNDVRYHGAIRALPCPQSFLGDDVIAREVVEDGVGVPDQRTGLVEAVPGEIARVVELVVSSVSWHGDESLMVVTTNNRTAKAIRAAVYRELANLPQLADFFDPSRSEPFLVLTIAQAATRSRDRVIFSLGYGRTPHGRMLTQFGPISGDENGERALATAFTRARHHLTLVSCFRQQDVVLDRLSGGPLLLARTLFAADVDWQPPAPAPAQPMLGDLGRRLQDRGLKVLANYGGLGLAVAAPDGESAYLVETDADFGHGTLREQLRLHPNDLRRMAWGFMRVYSFELFSHPDAVADTIARALRPALPPIPDGETSADGA
jgi:hypothetical protein